MEIENQMETRYGSSSSKVNKTVPKRNQTDDNDENSSNPSNPSESSNSTSSSNSSGSSDSTEELGSEQRPISVQTERKRNKKIKALLESVIDDDSYLDPMLSDEESVSNDERSEISENSDNDENIIDEQFTAPDWDDFDDNSDFAYLNSSTEFSESWILLWIYKYQSRFRLSDVAINSLIQFFGQVLKDTDPKRFHNFPSSSHNAKKLLQIEKNAKTYAVCPKCNKLHKTAEISEDNKCKFVEFPNHPMKKYRAECGAELLKNIPVTNGYVKRPHMVFPMPDLKSQVFAMYQRPGFEQNLTKWAHRHVDENTFADIYDGEIWKTFPSSDGLEGSLFFTPEFADTNLGIIINLDWFQPFDSSVYSTGVIYGAICNLPREIRFRQENMLILGLLPGPSEVRTDKINHYLSPIVDELLEFWAGAELQKTADYPNGRTIRMAVICCSSDIPAARKLCGHISSLAACHRCYKKASCNEEEERPNFGGFDDINEWFIQRDLEELRREALAWRRCNSKEERNKHVSSNHVRWTELLRLPYFNPIRHCVIDPMHNLFLGIAHWIVKRLWIDGGKISKEQLEIMQIRANNIKMPADLGRVPNKIATGEGFSGFTADQWKTFILVYATPLMWDLLSRSDREILANFVRACTLLIYRIIDNNMLNEAHDRLLKVGQLIEEHYGQQLITSNIHLSLHITECCRDYGPLYAFWCYSFERMNGILGKTL
jgi:hypothetical protein